MRLLSDLRYFHRLLTRSTGQSIAIWICTAIWIAVAPALLSLLGILEWKSFPFPQSDRIVQINAGFDMRPILSMTSHFKAISIHEAGWLVIEGPRRSASVICAVVEPDFFEVFEIRPLAGRVFTPGNISSDIEGAVLTESLSRHLFGSPDPPIRAVFSANGRKFAVLGVIADRPVYPPQAEVWFLRLSGIRPDPAFLPSQFPHLGIVGRLSETTNTQAADATLRALTQEFEKREDISQGDVEVVPLSRLLRRSARGESGILRVSLVGLLGFVLLAYISALSGFLLERQREFAIRISLGAHQADLARLLLIQIVFLATPGFITGVPISLLILRKLKDLVPLSVAELIPPTLDLESLALAIAGWITICIVSVSSVWLSAPRIGLGSILVPERAEVKKTGPQVQIRLVFVSAALGLALTLGAIAAMLRQSIDNLHREPLGFEPRNAVSAVVRFSKPPMPSSLSAVLARIADRVAAVPGVAAVSFSDSLLFGDSGSYLEVTTPDQSEFWLARCRGITGDYVEATGMRLVAGREIAPLEQDTGAPVALLDEEGARKIFGRRLPLGKTIILQDQPVELIGVVSSIKGSSLDESHHPQVYLPLSFRLRESAPAAFSLIARITRPVLKRDISSATEAIGVSMSQYRSVAETVEASLIVQYLAQDLATLQWITALALAALAMFATLSWLLELRAHEFAIRLAIGETRTGIVWRVLQSVLWLLVLAILLGFVLYLPASHAVRSLLFGVDVMSPKALLKAISGISAATVGAAAAATKVALQRLSLDLLRHPELN